jgi:hypothetical protein
MKRYDIEFTSGRRANLSAESARDAVAKQADADGFPDTVQRLRKEATVWEFSDGVTVVVNNGVPIIVREVNI